MQLYLYLKAKTSQDYYPKYTWLWFSGLSFSYWTIKPNSFGSCSCTTRNTRWIWCAASWGGNFVWWMMTKLALSHGLSHKTACTTEPSPAQWPRYWKIVKNTLKKRIPLLRTKKNLEKLWYKDDWTKLVLQVSFIWIYNLSKPSSNKILAVFLKILLTVLFALAMAGSSIRCRSKNQHHQLWFRLQLELVLHRRHHRGKIFLPRFPSSYYLSHNLGFSIGD